MSVNGRNDRHASLPAWRSRRVQDANKELKQEQQSKSRHGQANASSSHNNSSIASSSMRQARLKPVPGNASIELLSSPSRGLDVSADPSQDLTKPETQQRFRHYVSERLAKHITQHGQLNTHASRTRLFPLPWPGQRASAIAAGLHGAALQSLQEILLLVRKLREGCVAAGRTDAFTLDTYILSTLLSLLTGDNIQLSSSLPRTADLFLALKDDDDGAGNIGEMLAEKEIMALVGGEHDKAKSRFDVHYAFSLLLLWLLISGGQADRLGAAQQGSTRRTGGTLAFHQAKARISTHAEASAPLRIAEEAHRVFASDDVIGLRSLLLDTNCGNWHRALLCRVVEEKRRAVWQTLQKSYLHLAIDDTLIEGGTVSPQQPRSAQGSDWLERILLIDVEVLPISDEEAKTAAPQQQSTLMTSLAGKGETPDSWDDSIDEVVAGLAGTSLSDSAGTRSIRTSRLAAAFDTYGLPRTDGKSGKAENLEPWRGRFVTQAGSTVIKLR